MAACVSLPMKNDHFPHRQRLNPFRIEVGRECSHPHLFSQRVGDVLDPHNRAFLSDRKLNQTISEVVSSEPERVTSSVSSSKPLLQSRVRYRMGIPPMAERAIDGVFTKFLIMPCIGDAHPLGQHCRIKCLSLSQNSAPELATSSRSFPRTATSRTLKI